MRHRASKPNAEVNEISDAEGYALSALLLFKELGQWRLCRVGHGAGDVGELVKYQ